MNDKWQDIAINTIKKEMLNQGIKYPELVEKLKEIGVKEDRTNLSNKIQRGTFSFTLVVQIYRALEVSTINIIE